MHSPAPLRTALAGAPAHSHSPIASQKWNKKLQALLGTDTTIKAGVEIPGVYEYLKRAHLGDLASVKLRALLGQQDAHGLAGVDQREYQQEFGDVRVAWPPHECMCP